MELDVCFFFVFLGSLLTFHRHRSSPYAQLLDVLSSAYLLYATFTREFYIRHTEVAQWRSDICSALSGDTALIYDYISISIVSWVASSFLEYTSSVSLVKLYMIQLRKLRKITARFSQIEWSHGRFVVLVTASVCTVNSLCLTLILWGSVQKSFENVSEDVSVLVFLTLAAIMRLIRQSMEGLTFIAGIATREFEWRNSKSRKLFGRITFSSFVLLVHSSTLTYTFANQERKVWGLSQYTIFAGLWTDVIFRLFVCGWATINSCCFVKAKESVPKLVKSCCTASLHVTRSLSHSFLTVLTLFVYIILYVCFCLIYTISHVYRLIVSTLTYIVVALILFVIFVVTHMLEAWRAYVIHWQDELLQIAVDFDNPALELVEEDLERGRDHEREELVCPPVPFQRRYLDMAHPHLQCPELATQHIIRIQPDTCIQPNPYIIPFSSSDEPLPTSSTDDSSDYADPVDIGGPFPRLRLEVECVREQAPPPPLQ